ncbi:protein FAR1-related sequence 8-like [Senna tora]|uniref:Protein FAR1-related sequence 8-like n=1 Tax=Senna tora TaxID=362788 RepID=A0A834U2Y4_9FABA|nr:protein FAR1-related sequence 8-like [Senna tora]
MSFAELKQLIHRTLKLPQNQEVSEIIYRMSHGRNPVNFLYAEVSDDEGMGNMLHCHMQCLEFLPIPVIEICANTSTAVQPFEVSDYIPHIEFNRRGDQECGTSHVFEGDDINEDGLEMSHEMFNMPTTEPNDELLDDEEFDGITGNDIEDPPDGAEYEDEDFDDNSEVMQMSVGGGEVWNETSNLKKGLVFPDKKSLGEAVKIFSFKRHVNYSVTRKAWLGKQKALAMVYGNWEASYGTLRRWMRAVQKHLLGTIISFQHHQIPNNDSDVQFLRLFWAFKPCIDAWPHLKPMIQVDGTFLYGKHHHTLLITMGQDGNRNIVPLAFTIVEGETKEAWAWFLFRVREFVVGRQEGVCLISDKSTGCLAAVEDEAVGWQPPLGHHVYCIRQWRATLTPSLRATL